MLTGSGYKECDSFHELHIVGDGSGGAIAWSAYPSKPDWKQPPGRRQIPYLTHITRVDSEGSILWQKEVRGVDHMVSDNVGGVRYYMLSGLQDTCFLQQSSFIVAIIGGNPCEPDVVLGLETEGNQVHLLLIEAKYYSGLSSEEDERAEPNDQLARELDNLDVLSVATLGWGTHLEIASRTLLFVTQDMGIPRDLLLKSLAE